MRQDIEFDVPETRLARRTFLPFEGLVRCEIYSLGVLLLFIFSDGKITAPGTVDVNPIYLQSAAKEIFLNLRDENSK